MSESRQAYFYTALRSDPGLPRIWLGRLRLLTVTQRLALLSPAFALVVGALLAALLLAPAGAQVGWLPTGGVDLRAFALEPGQLHLERDAHGARLELDDHSLLLKYRQPDAAQQVQVHTPHTTAVTRDAVFFTEVQGDATRIGVQRGHVVLFSTDGHVTFAGPGEQLVVSGDETRRERGAHPNFAFLALLFPHPAAVELSGVPEARVAPRTAPPLERVARATPSPPRRRGLLPRKPRQTRTPAPHVQVITPSTAYDKPYDGEDLGAPVIVSVEGAPPAPPTTATTPIVEMPRRTPAPVGETSAGFAPPASWWQ